MDGFIASSHRFNPGVRELFTGPSLNLFTMTSVRSRSLALAGACLLTPCVASAQAVQPATPALSAGDTAWMLTATALVLFMTLPGLALFYGGLVRAKNYLSVLMHCVAVAGLASVLWVIGLYGLSFTPGNSWIGGLSALGLHGIGGLAGRTYPETVFVMFQMTFAIITPGLIIGAFVERLKFSAMLVFTALWLVLVYAPVTHWVWGGGWMQQLGVIDLAGGIVVHATAGIAALVLAWLVGPRAGYPTHMHPPHSPGLVMVGAGMLWVGWFGFNAGSQGGANEAAGLTMLVTHISAAVGGLTWMTLEWRKNGKPGLVGIVTGLVAGLATITPASGNVSPLGAVLIGLLAGSICYYMCVFIRRKLCIDDALDVFAVHGVGGILGTLIVSVLGSPRFGGHGVDHIGAQFLIQAKCVGFTLLWSGLISLVIGLILKKTIGLRVDASAEDIGLDQAEHGETAYHLE